MSRGVQGTNTIVTILNACASDDARRRLYHCCGSTRWVELMLAEWPYATDASLQEAAERAWDQLDRADWLEAFAQHPRIGDLESLRRKFVDTAHLAAGEQAGVKSADTATLTALAEGNRRYEERFGYIFIVCATGKSAAEMLALLQSRLPNDPETELALAAAEQKKITILRFGKIGET